MSLLHGLREPRAGLGEDRRPLHERKRVAELRAVTRRLRQRLGDKPAGHLGEADQRRVHLSREAGAGPARRRDGPDVPPPPPPPAAPEPPPQPPPAAAHSAPAPP